LELDWYKEYFVNSVKQIDYSVDSVYAENETTWVRLRKVKPFIMPIDLVVTLKDGSRSVAYIPLDLMRGEKKQEWPELKQTVYPDWTWTYPTYLLKLDIPLSNIKSLEIDPSRRMADVERSNNIYPR
jgi:hypothetical protein